jgi:hypothetical protein
MIPSRCPRCSDNFNARLAAPFRAERSYLWRLLASSQTAVNPGIGVPDRRFGVAAAFVALHCRDAASGRRATPGLQLLYPIAIPGQP